MPGVSYRSSQIGNVTIPKPPGTVTGDLIFISIQSQEVIAGAGSTITAPAGFTDVFAGTGTFFTGSWQIFMPAHADGLRQFWYVGWKIAAPGEPASWTATINGFLPGFAEVQSFGATYQNPDPVTPVLAISNPDPGFGSGLNFQDFTPGAADSLIVEFAATVAGSSGFGWSIPNDQAITAVTETYTTEYLVPLIEPAPGVLGNDVYDPGHLPATSRFDVSSGDGIESALWDYPWHSAGATGPHSYSPGGANIACCVSVALKNSATLQPTIADCHLSAVAPFAAGGMTLNADGSFTYLATAGPPPYVDHFGYKLETPDRAYSSTTTDEIDVTAPPAQPVDDFYFTTVGARPMRVLAPGVMDNDIDPTTVSLNTAPVEGSVVLNADGSFVYTLAPGFIGDDTFIYNGNGGTATVTISIFDSFPTASFDEKYAHKAFEAVLA